MEKRVDGKVKDSKVRQNIFIKWGASFVLSEMNNLISLNRKINEKVERFHRLAVVYCHQKGYNILPFFITFLCTLKT